MKCFAFACVQCGKDYDLPDPQTDQECECGAPLRRVYVLAGVTFKGTGFYSNDKKILGKVE